MRAAEDLPLVGLSAADLAQLGRGELSMNLRRRLRGQRWVALLGCACLALILLGLGLLTGLMLLAPGLGPWPLGLASWAIGLFWAWLVYPSVGRWIWLGQDLAQQTVGWAEGRGTLQITQPAVGFVRLARYELRIAERRWQLSQAEYAQLMPHAAYRVVYALRSGVFLGAVPVAGVQPGGLPGAKLAPRLADPGVEKAGAARALQPTLAERATVGPAGQPTTFDQTDKAPAQEMPELTAQERAILDLLIAGYSNKEIAQRLAFSVNTIKMYASQLYRKLGVGQRTAAVAEARRRGYRPKA